MKYDIAMEYRGRWGRTKRTVTTVEVDTLAEAREATHERLREFAEANPKIPRATAIPLPRP